MLHPHTWEWGWIITVSIITKKKYEFYQNNDYGYMIKCKLQGKINNEEWKILIK
jgi:hypothetical protein